jgi:hypothetical protein
MLPVGFDGCFVGLAGGEIALPVALPLLGRLSDLAFHKSVSAIHHPFREIALPIERLCTGKTLAERQPGETKGGQN